MDWDGVIEKNCETLKRVLAALVAMAGLGAPSSPPHPELVEGVGEDGSARRGEAEPPAEPGEGCSSPVLTLPRHLHRAVLRLLRPAEAAVRRLVIIAASGLTVEPPRQRPRKARPEQKAAHAALRSLGLAVVASPADFVQAGKRQVAALRQAAARRAAARPRGLILPLFDPIRVPRPNRPRHVPPHAAPRILSFDGYAPHRLPPPPSPGDLIDATRLALRLSALSSVLEDLPKHARRFARWKACRRPDPRPHAGGPKDGRDAWLAPAGDHAKHGGGGFKRQFPLRPGLPPGLSAANRRRPTHEVHDVLGDLQYFAFEALRRPDTS